MSNAATLKPGYEWWWVRRYNGWDVYPQEQPRFKVQARKTGKLWDFLTENGYPYTQQLELLEPVK